MAHSKMTVEQVVHSEDGKTVTLHCRTDTGNLVVYSAPAGTTVTRIKDA